MRPRSAAALVSGCQPELTEVALPPADAAARLEAEGKSTRAYQYQTPTRIAKTIMRQPRRRKKPFIFASVGGGGLVTWENTLAQAVHASRPDRPFRIGVLRRRHDAGRAS